MRHLLSVLLALVFTPIVYICAGFSAVWFAESTARGDTDTVKALLGLGAALVAGAFYAVLVMGRLSPLGPILAGLLLLGIGGWSIADPQGFASAVPGTLLGVGNVLHAATPFGTSLLAIPLLSTVFSPRRWRRSVRPAGVGYEAGPVYPAAPGSAAPAYGTPSGAAPTYAATLADQTSVSAGYASELADTAARPAYQPPTYADSSTTFSGFTPTNPATTTDDDDPNRTRFM